MTPTDEADLDKTLARALGPDADDTAPLSRAVLSRLSEPASGHRPFLAEVLADPLPAAGLLLGLLVLTVATSYALMPVGFDEVGALAQLLDLGF